MDTTSIAEVSRNFSRFWGGLRRASLIGCSTG